MDWQPIVNRLATTTTIVAVVPDPSAVGQPTTVTTSVAAIAADAGVPTGSVTVSDGAGSNCTAALTAGVGQCTLTATAAGDQTLVAVYSGDSMFNSSTGRHAHTVVSLNTPPVVATPLFATPNPVSGNTTSLSVLGADDGGEANLTHTDGRPSTVAFSANGTNAAKSVVATFGAPGSYAIMVTITDGGGLTATTAMTVVVIAPVVIAINERVSVTDATGSPIAMAEPIHVVDNAVVSVSGSTAAPPLSIAVNEHVSISDSMPQTAPIAERVHVVDRATVTVRATGQASAS